VPDPLSCRPPGPPTRPGVVRFLLGFPSQFLKIRDMFASGSRLLPVCNGNEWL
jgi:hypothetical protein